MLEKFLACKGVLRIQICSGKNFKSREKQIWRKIKYEISTDLGSPRARRFEYDKRDFSPALTYHCSAHPGEVDEDELSTLRYTFFDHLLLDQVVVGSLGWDSGEPQSACPSLSGCIMKRCSSLCLNLKNMSSFPTRKWISPLPTSILALADLRKGRPSTKSTPRSPSISIITKSARMKESRTHTKTCSAIPLGYQTVESASCTSIVVGERAGYSSSSYITLGIMFTLAPRSHRHRSKCLT